MSSTNRTTDELSAINRRRFLRGLVGCGCAAALPTVPGCTVSEIYDDPKRGAVTFDLVEAGFEALEEVGGMVSMDLGARKIVLVRRDESEIIALDRICTHLGCDMAPDREGSWAGDALVCRCHGSRFSPLGRVIDGPASTDLVTHEVDFDPETGRGTLFVGVVQEAKPDAETALSPDAGEADAGPVEVPLVGSAEVDPETRTFTIRVANEPALTDVGGVRALDAGGRQLLIIRVEENRFVTLDRICTHRQCDMAPHSLGSFSGGELSCMCHGSRFAPDGTVVQGPASLPLMTFTTHFDAGTGAIVVEIPEEAA